MKSISEENHMYIHVHTCAKVIVHSSQDCLSNCIWQYTWPRGPLNGSLHSLGCRSWWRNLNAKSNHVCPKNGALTCIAFTCIAFTNPLVAPSKTRLLTNLHTFGSFFSFLILLFTAFLFTTCRCKDNRETGPKKENYPPHLSEGWFSPQIRDERHKKFQSIKIYETE